MKRSENVTFNWQKWKIVWKNPPDFDSRHQQILYQGKALCGRLSEINLFASEFHLRILVYIPPPAKNLLWYSLKYVSAIQFENEEGVYVNFLYWGVVQKCYILVWGNRKCYIFGMWVPGIFWYGCVSIMPEQFTHQ